MKVEEALYNVLIAIIDLKHKAKQENISDDTMETQLLNTLSLEGIEFTR